MDQQSEKKGLCGCGKPVRKEGQRYCKECHSEYMKQDRKSKKIEDNYFFDDKWSELLYNILSNLNHEQKLRLSHKEQLMIQRDNAVKKFVTSGSLKQQMVLFTKIGYDWFFGLYPVGKDVPGIMQKAYKQHTIKETRVDVIQEQLDNHVFIIDNKSVAIAMAMMAMNNHSEEFLINSNFLKAPSVFEGYKKNHAVLSDLLKQYNPGNVAAVYKDTLKAMDFFNEIVGEVMNAEALIENLFRLNNLDYWILHFLFKHRNNYVSVEYIKRNIGHLFSPKAIALRCNYLWRDKGFIDKMPKTEPVSYTIKSDGILILGEIMNTIINRSIK